MEYYTINKASKLLKVTTQTLRNWDKNGKLKPDKTGCNGYRYYSKERIDKILNVDIPKEDRITIGYCRVSSKKQSDDLERQIENVKTYMYAKGYQFKIITDIGSGINYNKKGLIELLKIIEEDRVDKVVVLYKDRLLRFGFELIEQIALLHQTTIEIIDNTDKTVEQELVEDLIQIVTVFSCKLQGRRSKQTS